VRISDISLDSDGYKISKPNPNSPKKLTSVKTGFRQKLRAIRRSNYKYLVFSLLQSFYDE